MGKFEDLTGKMYGRWTVIERAANHGTAVRYLCRCECGTLRIVLSGSLKNGSSSSCGCMHKENVSARNRSQGARGRLDLSGSSSGMLTYQGEAGIRNGHRRIIAMCACGNETELLAKAYINGNTKSCGCLQKKVARISLQRNRKG